jgi:hypothetical protein
MELCTFCFNRRELEIEDENGKLALAPCPECSSRQSDSENRKFKAAMDAAITAAQQFARKRSAQFSVLEVA